MESGTDHDIFISYSSADEHVAREIRSGLERWGVDVWIARRDISGGRDWRDVIANSIVSCRGVVFLSSRSAHRSRMTRKEILFAEAEQKPIVPVRLDDEEPPPVFRFSLGHVHWVDISDSCSGQTNAPCPAESDLERIARAVDDSCPNVEVEPPVDDEEIPLVLEAEADEIVRDVSDVLFRRVGTTPINLPGVTREFVDDVIDLVHSVVGGYLVEFTESDGTIVRISSSGQTEAMKESTEYLVRNRGLLDEVDIPWVPGNNKAILNDTDHWSDATPDYVELDGGTAFDGPMYLDTRMDKSRKRSVIHTMAEMCEVPVEFYGKW